MSMKKIEISVPEDMIAYVIKKNEDDILKQNAMILYPYVQNNTISHGKAAELLGIHKLDLISLYGNLGISYFDESSDETFSDLQSIKNLRMKLQ